MKLAFVLCFGLWLTPPLSQIAPQEASVWIKEHGEALASVNSQNRVYILTHTPKHAAELAVFRNGLYQTEGEDYTLLDRTVTFVSAPLNGDDIRFWYRAVP